MKRLHTNSLLVFFLLLIFGIAQDAYCQSCLKVTKKGAIKISDVNRQGVCGKRGILLSEIVNNSGVSVTGPSGPQGPVGPTGAAGATGASGTAGTDGQDGMDAAWGDGSAGSKTVTSNGQLATESHQYEDFIVESGVTLSVPSGTIIRCTGTFTNKGTIVVNTFANGGGQGTSATALGTAPAHPGVSRRAAGPGEVGASLAEFRSGGLGGVGIGSNSQAATLLRIPQYGGGGGGPALNTGSSLAGGGSFAVYCQGALVNEGTIQANGATGSTGDGGAGGGLIVLASAGSVTNIGSIEVTGGDGGAASSNQGSGGGGGGGILTVLAPTIDVDDVTVDRSGGTGASAESAGTVSNGFMAAGGGGGACGGSGGQGGSVDTDGSVAVGGNGSIGLIVRITANNPAGLLN